MGGIVFFKTPTDLESGKWYPDSSGIKTYTEDRIDKAITHRDSVLKDVYDKLDELNTDLADVLSAPTLDVTLGAIDTNLIPSPVVVPPTPTRPNISTTYPDAPNAAALGTVQELTLDPVPVLSATAPTLSPVTPPTPFAKTAPVADPLPTHAMPDQPGYTLPTAPTQRVLTLPTAPEPITLTFDGVLPTALDAPPSTAFNFTEQDYVSALNSQLKTSLLDLVLNVRQTGLNPVIEDQIWARGRERTQAEANRRRAAARRQFAALGWNMPQGDEALLLQQAEEAAITDDITESRNIAVEQAKLEQANFQFAFTQAIALEGQLINLHNNVQQRAFEAARFAVESAISLYNVKVAYFNANVALYGVQAQVYRDKLQAELAKIEIYKAQLEGQKLINELNAQDVALYKAQIDAVVALFELYKDQLEAVKIQIEADGLKIQQFEANIRAFVAEVQAKNLEYEGYKTQLSGQEIQANIYKILVDAFGQEVAAFSASTDAKVKKLDADIKVNFDVPLKVLEQNTEVYKTKVQAKTAEIQGLTEIYKSDADVFGKLVDAEGTRVKTGVDLLQWELAKVSKELDAKVEVFKANITTLLTQKDMIVDARAKEAQLQAQIAAAIGGAVNFAAHISGSSAYENAAPMAFTY